MAQYASHDIVRVSSVIRNYVCAQTYSCQNVEHLLNDNCATKTGCDHGPSFHAMMNIRTYVHSIYNSTVTY